MNINFRICIFMKMPLPFELSTTWNQPKYQTNHLTVNQQISVFSSVSKIMSFEYSSYIRYTFDLPLECSGLMLWRLLLAIYVQYITKSSNVSFYFITILIRCDSIFI